MDAICCPVSAGLNFRGTKLSQMAVEPRNAQKFSTAKIKVHTVWEVYVLPPRLAVHTVQPFVRVSFHSSHAMGNSTGINFITVFLCSGENRDYFEVRSAKNQHQTTH